MRRSWTRTRRVPRLAIPVLAILALGSAATASPLVASAAVASPSSTGRAPVHAPAGARVTWHSLTLRNGWKSAQHLDTTGNPAWAVKGQVVYLSGSLHQARGSSTEFAVLPSAARPSHAMYITNYTLNGSHGHLYAKPDGELFAYGLEASSFFSLAGISFPARSMAQHGLALRNGWNSSQFRWNTGDPSYAVRNGVVYLSGSVHQRVGSSDIFAKLPVAARPSHNLYIIVDTFDATVGVLHIFTDGTMEAYDGSARSFTSLAGVSFPVGLLANTLTLENGWQSSDGTYGTGDPSYATHGGVVYLSGSLNLPSGHDGIFAQLPHSAAPAHYLYMKIYANGGAIGSLEVQPSGELEIFTDNSASELFSSLATISYPLGS
jgi:hypothetical protein